MQSSIKFLKYLSSAALCFSLLGCPVATSDSDSDMMTMLATIAALSNIQIGGSHNYYNGTTSYTDTCGGFCSNGDTKVGEYIFLNNSFTQKCTNTKDCGSTLPADNNAVIFEYDNTKKILYAQFDSSHPYTPNKFTFIQWTVVDGYTYICPDIANVGSQDTLAKAKDFNGDGVEDYTVANNTSNINGGCGGAIFWSRLEKQ